MLLLITVSIIFSIIIGLDSRIVTPFQLQYNNSTDPSVLTNNDDKAKAKHLINYVISSYNDANDYSLFKPTNVNNIYTINTTIGGIFGVNYTHKAGLVYLFNDYAIVSFRGTCFKIDELIDSEIEYYTYPQTDIKVHRGFHKYYLGFKDELLKYISNVNKVYITGHSLGASVALITAYELKNKDISLFLYGCPKSGNKNFVDSFDNAVSIVNYFDIIPESPEIINKMFAIQNIYIFGIEQANDKLNHSIELYNDGIDCMEKLNTKCV